MITITQAQRELYRSEGHMILPGVIPPELLEMLREECSYYLGYYDSIMDAKGVHRVTPELRPEDAEMPIGSWIDPDNFNPGYIMRSLHLLPQRGDKPEWQHTQDYWFEKDALPNADLEDGCLVFE